MLRALRISAMAAPPMLLAALFAMLLAPPSHADDSVYWVDVRTPEEHRQGHLPGSLNIEYQNIAEGIKALGVAPDAVIYLHCRSGRRSGIALKTLQSLGYSNVMNLGGYEEAQKYHSAYLEGKVEGKAEGKMK